MTESRPTPADLAKTLQLIERLANLPRDGWSDFANEEAHDIRNDAKQLRKDLGYP